MENMKNYEAILAVVRGFHSKAEEGSLTEQEILDVWEAERALEISLGQFYGGGVRPSVGSYHDTLDGGVPWYHPMGPDMKPEKARMLSQPDVARWSVAHRIPLPYIAEWIIFFPKDFASVAMDHAAFVRRILDDEVLGERVRHESAELPDLLEALPQDEKWRRLDAAIGEFGTKIRWGWPCHTAKWSRTKTIELILKHITQPEIAGAFLANCCAMEGWSVFNNPSLSSNLFVQVLSEAAKVAPYEANSNRLWIAAMAGDIRQNKISFFESDPACWNYLDGLKLRLMRSGEREMAQVLKVAGESIDRACRGEDIPLSACSSFLVSLARGFMKRAEPEEDAADDEELDASGGEVEDDEYDAEGDVVEDGADDGEDEALLAEELVRLAAVLQDMPDCAFGHELVSRFWETDSSLAFRYRLLLSPDRVFDRDLYLINYCFAQRGEPWVDDSPTTKGTWFEQAMRREMQVKGWDFYLVKKHENPRNRRRGYDLQIEMRDGFSIKVYKLENGRFSADYYREGQEVMIPPVVDVGEPVFQKGNFAIYSIGEKFVLAEPIKLRPQDEEGLGLFY